MLELRDIVWAQPIVVSESKQVSIALLANDPEQIDYEIYSQDRTREIVHCQGRAVWSRQLGAGAGSISSSCKAADGARRLEPSGSYAATARMGLILWARVSWHRRHPPGKHEVLAQLRLPRTSRRRRETMSCIRA